MARGPYLSLLSSVIRLHHSNNADQLGANLNNDEGLIRAATYLAASRAREWGSSQVVLVAEHTLYSYHTVATSTLVVMQLFYDQQCLRRQ